MRLLLIALLLLSGSVGAQEIELELLGTFRTPLGQPSGAQGIEIGDCGATPCLAVDFDGQGSQSSQGLIAVPPVLDGRRADRIATWTGHLAVEISLLDAEDGWGNKGVLSTPPVPIGPNRYVTICGHDWYLPTVNYDTHCWFDTSTGETRGPHHIGLRSDELADRNTARYLTRVPQPYADEHYGAAGEPWCWSGFRKPGPGKVYGGEPIAGPTLFAHPCGWPELPARSEITPAIPVLGQWYQNPYSSATGELAGTLRLPADPGEPEDWPYNDAGILPGDVAAGRATVTDGSSIDLVWMITRKGSRWYEYHDDTRPLYNCLQTATQLSDCYPAIRPNRQRPCPQGELIPGTQELCNPAFDGLSAYWDNRGEDPLFAQLGPAFDAEKWGADACNLDKGFGATFPSDWQGNGGGWNLELWAWDAADFPAGGLTPEALQDPDVIPQPIFRHVLRRRICGGGGAVAFDGDRLYVVPGIGPDVEVYQVTVIPTERPQDPLCDPVSVELRVGGVLVFSDEVGCEP